MPRVLEMGGNIAMIIIAVVVVAIGTTRYFEDSESVRVTDVADPAAPAAQIHDTLELGLRESELTVLIGTASTCKFCTASMPFYERLAAVTQKRGLRLVAYTHENVGVNREYLASHKVYPDAVISAATNGLYLPATPRLLVVRRDGTVVKGWEGQLDSAHEDDVLQAIQE